MRIIFAGTPDFAASHLQAMLDEKHNVVAVYTQPDRPSGRGNKLTASAVKTLALEHSLPVFQPESLKTEQAQHELREIHADLMVVVAYGLILPTEILTAPSLGCINVHGSILPKWRGAAPIQRAIWAGDTETGITIMQMDEGLDTGDILSTHRINIEKDDTSALLYQKLADLGPKALVSDLEKFASLTAIKQDNTLATHAAKLSKAEAYLDWQLSAQQLERNVRAFNPWPVAWFSYKEKPVKVWESAGEAIIGSEHLQTQAGQILSYDKNGLRINTSEGVLNISELQLPGKKTQAVSQLVNGQPGLFSAGDILQ